MTVLCRPRTRPRAPAPASWWELVRPRRPSRPIQSCTISYLSLLGRRRRRRRRRRRWQRRCPKMTTSATRRLNYNQRQPVRQTTLLLGCAVGQRVGTSFRLSCGKCLHAGARSLWRRKDSCTLTPHLPLGAFTALVGWLADVATKVPNVRRTRPGVRTRRLGDDGVIRTLWVSATSTSEHDVHGFGSVRPSVPRRRTPCSVPVVASTAFRLPRRRQLVVCVRPLLRARVHLTQGPSGSIIAARPNVNIPKVSCCDETSIYYDPSVLVGVWRSLIHNASAASSSFRSKQTFLHDVADIGVQVRRSKL